MKTIRKGYSGGETVELREFLADAGFRLATSDPALFDADLDRAVRAYQEDERLESDGVVGPKTWTALEVSGPVRCGSWPVCARDKRLSDALAIVRNADGIGLRYAKVASVQAWQELQDGKDWAFVVPKVTSTDPRYPTAHGCTCGHWGWLFASFWTSFAVPGQGIYPTWRTGRSGRWIWTVPVAGAIRKGALIRGIADYVNAAIRIKAGMGLAALYPLVIPGPGASHFALIEYPSHVATAIRIDDDVRAIDPRTGQPMRHGWYRVAADGGSDPEMERFTLRRIGAGDVGGARYTAVLLPDPGKHGCMIDGPLAGGEPWPMEVEA